MGLFKKFSRKKEVKQQETIVKPSAQNPPIVATKQETKPIVSFKDQVKEIIVLSQAGKIEVNNESKFPSILDTRYEIHSVKKIISSLKDKGLIRKPSALESLENLKLADLKQIASDHNLKATGKKAELISRIQETLPEEQVKDYVHTYMWMPTEEGQKVLDSNTYIGLYFNKHKYDLYLIRFDIYTLAEMAEKNPNMPIRDLVWGYLNKYQSEQYSNAIQESNFHDYCECLHIMALFLEEENRINDALSTYSRYLYAYVNYNGIAKALLDYHIFKEKKSASETFSLSAEIMPFMVSEFKDLCNSAGLESSKDIKAYLVDNYKKEQNLLSAFEPEELAKYIVDSLEGISTDEKRKRAFNKVFQRMLEAANK